MKNKTQNKCELKIIIVLISLIFIMPLIFADTMINWSGSYGNAQTHFNSGGAPECVVDSGINYWKDAIDSFTPSDNDCLRTLTNGENITCCPQQFTCNITSKKCVENKIPILSCSDYKTPEKCGGFNIADVEGSIYNILIANLNLTITSSELKFCHEGQSNTFEYESTAEGCRVYWGCDCVWNSTDCLGVYYSNNCTDVDEPPTPIPDEKCITSDKHTKNLCGSEEDVYRVSWTGNFFINDAPQGKTEACKDGSKDFPCPSVSLIPFFTLMNFMISCLAIAGVYLFLKKRK